MAANINILEIVKNSKMNFTWHMIFLQSFIKASPRNVSDKLLTEERKKEEEE
jgi:hypothetical protein